jgi:hypothetical protein
MFILTFDEFVKAHEANVVNCNFTIEEDDGYEACSCRFIDGETILPCQGCNRLEDLPLPFGLSSF